MHTLTHTHTRARARTRTHTRTRTRTHTHTHTHLKQTPGEVGLAQSPEVRQTFVHQSCQLFHKEDPVGATGVL